MHPLSAVESPAFSKTPVQTSNDKNRLLVLYRWGAGLSSKVCALGTGWLPPQFLSCVSRQLKPDAIPLQRKLCYAVGGIPYQITNIAIGFCLQVFLLDVVRMEASFVSLILFLSRAWDAITDPLVGYLVSRTTHTPIGKLLPWMVISTPLGILSYVLLWLVPGDSASLAVTLPWYLITCCLFETFMSCYHVPYTSLNMFLGGRQADRDSATAYRMCLEMLAMLFSSVVQGQVMRVFYTEREHVCLDTEVPTSQHAHSTLAPVHPALPNTRKAFMTSAVVLGSIYFLCSLTLFLGVKEQHGQLQSEEKTHQPYFSSLKMLVQHAPYTRLVLGFLFSSLAFQMSLGNFALFCTHASGLGPQFQYIILVLLSSAAVSVPVWQVLLVRVGKRTALFIGLPLFIPAVIVLVSVPSNLAVYMAMSVLSGSSLATLFLLPWSMLPDVIDDFALKNPTCREIEPLFFSCYVFCNKLGGGLSIGFSTMVLHFAGYKAGACKHGDGVITALRVLFAPVPIGLLVLGLVFFYLCPINETHQRLSRTTPNNQELSTAEAVTCSTEVDTPSAVQSLTQSGSVSPGVPPFTSRGQRSSSRSNCSHMPGHMTPSRNSRQSFSSHRALKQMVPPSSNQKTTRTRISQRHTSASRHDSLQHPIRLNSNLISHESQHSDLEPVWAKVTWV
ncbi:sodium-dependent lysophosphatidylcholine symporter 1-like [Sardina pilchardus]|uniref:sodium-dependent lysophosphatidylcholine symporter 1-like n=1 Tax=Sardina pilchardus TaxID=27697 RepID=UPI002E0F5BFD